MLEEFKSLQDVPNSVRTILINDDPYHTIMFCFINDRLKLYKGTIFLYLFIFIYLEYNLDIL